jgi:cyclopropane fatty-acyl-phospholipid synthase-like methyltransferase
MAGGSSQSVHEHQWQDPAYVDTWVEQRIDGDERHRLQVERLARVLAGAVTGADPIVLDVGTGPGVLADAVLRLLPAARVVAQDFSPPMLELARSRLAWAGDRVRFHLSDLLSTDWARGLDPGFDAVVSSYAIHNVRDPATIRSVYGEIVALLVPGGCLLLMDLVESPGPRADALVGMRGRRGDGEPATLAAQLEWLAGAGLVEVDCLWKDGFEATICGFRP